MSDPLPPEVASRITTSTRWRRVEFRTVVDSTNTIVSHRAAEGAEPGLVVVAERQTAGRGRLDRRWLDQPGGSLAVTALVDPPVPPTLVPMAAGLAVADAAAAQGVATALKWPNDVLAAGRKAAGILVEAVAGGRLAVGIGVNVDWRERGPEVDPSWGSLAEAVGRAVDRWALLADLLGSLDGRLGQPPEALLDDYRANCTTLGTQVRIELPGREVHGLAEEVGPDGSLRVRTDDGPVEVLAGDVHHVHPG